LFFCLAVAGVVYAFSTSVWTLSIVALTGALSTEVIESGPFTSLEQAMISTERSGRAQVRSFGAYNAIAALAGSFGALGAAIMSWASDHWSSTPTQAHDFLGMVPIGLLGMAIARTLSRQAEAPKRAERGPARLVESKPTVIRLSGLFALDSFGGGFTVSAFIAYWLNAKFDASTGQIGVLFFAIGLLQTGSFLAAPRLAERFGLLRTMVFTHLPSNLLLIAVAFAPTFGVASVLLLARTALSQMDVPTRQSYVMALVPPAERTPAAAYTNTVRYITRPLGPPLAAAMSQVVLGLPFLMSGGIKTAYDLTLWSWFRTVPLPTED
jgi:MFS family permease